MCCVQCIRKKYHNYEEDTQDQILIFDKDKVVLDLPAEDCPPKVVNDWKILPLTYPQVDATYLTIKDNLHVSIVYDNLYVSVVMLILNFHRFPRLMFRILRVVELPLHAPLSWSGLVVVNQSVFLIK